MSTVSRHALSTGLQVDVERFEGEVVGFNEQAVTTVHQSSQLVDGIVRPGYVSSGVETLKSAWLRAADGMERRFDFSVLDVEARVGHRLRLSALAGDRDTSSDVSDVIGGGCSAQRKPASEGDEAP